MAERHLQPVTGRLTIDPIETIARADRLAAAELTRPKLGVDEGPDLVEPSRPLAAQGLSGTVERALGPVKLPTLLELVDALDDVAGHAGAMNDIDSSMSGVAKAVLSDEQNKVMRYLDLRDR